MNDFDFALQSTLQKILLFEQWSRGNTLSIHSLLILIECSKGAVIAQDLVNLRLYLNHCNSITALTKLVKRGLICKVDKSYSLTGKGQMVLNSFYSFCETYLKNNPI
jgi:predicted transcriptional regulator